ncbi:hypothetical protein X777_06307 [Ooceraea biroi]|uniref:Uncharacterized protein n=1 Tax=Ooceraea biroi TaxID=2015173 RepID=A0A026WBA9_OOCBI|nr:hypothetical protein X777_06307 [Ooceraea biroi]
MAAPRWSPAPRRGRKRGAVDGGGKKQSLYRAADGALGCARVRALRACVCEEETVEEQRETMRETSGQRTDEEAREGKRRREAMVKE